MNRFERFTDEAIKVVLSAQEEARAVRLSWVGSEMILLGLLAETNEIPARVLAARGLNLSTGRAAIELILGHGSAQPAPELPFTPRAIKIFDYAIDETKNSDFGEVEPEDILLGLIREAQQSTKKLGIAARVLQDCSIELVDLQSLLAETIQNTSPVSKLKKRIQSLHIAAESHYRNYMNPLSNLGVAACDHPVKDLQS